MWKDHPTEPQIQYKIFQWFSSYSSSSITGIVSALEENYLLAEYTFWEKEQ